MSTVRGDGTVKITDIPGGLKEELDNCFAFEGEFVNVNGDRFKYMQSSSNRVSPEFASMNKS